MDVRNKDIEESCRQELIERESAKIRLAASESARRRCVEALKPFAQLTYEMKPTAERHVPCSIKVVDLVNANRALAGLPIIAPSNAGGTVIAGSETITNYSGLPTTDITDGKCRSDCGIPGTETAQQDASGTQS